MNNPVRVKVEILFPDDDSHLVGKKFLDFHVHDATDPDSSGYPETDNISRSYEDLPKGKLPPGSILKLTPMFENKRPWEKKREIAAELSWVKPIYVPEYAERVLVHEGDGFKPPPKKGYKVDPDRRISAVLVTWTDNGGTSSGSVHLGDFDSKSYNVGSGETEIIPCDGHRAKDGHIHIGGHGIEVERVEVLYAD